MCSKAKISYSKRAFSFSKTKTSRLHEICKISAASVPVQYDQAEVFSFMKDTSRGNHCQQQWDSGPVALSVILLCLVTKVDGAVLELHKIRKSEAGSYLCIASNGHPPTVSRRVQLDIKCKTHIT